MDTVLKMTFYLVVGVVLLMTSVWFFKLVYDTATGGGVIVIPSFRIIGEPDEGEKIGSTLASMLQARLREIIRDLQTSQKILMKASEVQVTPLPEGHGRQPSLIPRFWAQQTVDLRTALFEPVNMDVKVGGVEVTGVLAWAQRRMISTRALNFTVYLDKKRAVITGNLDAFDPTDNAMQLELKNNLDQEKFPLDIIVDSIAYELVRRVLAKDPANKLEVLDQGEFKALLTVLVETAHLNRATLLGRPVRQKFANLLPKAEDLATQVPEWYQLNYLAASIAESAENQEKALHFYERVKEFFPKMRADSVKIDPNMIKAVEDRIAKLKPQIQPTLNANLAAAREKIQEDAVYAVRVLNDLFKTNLPVPPVQLFDPSRQMMDAFWDGKTYLAPPEVKDISDVTYHEIAMFFVENVAKLEYQGQAGAIVQSYADVLASLVKQKRLGQTAETANWLIGEGFAAWMTGRDILKEKEKSALRSLKEPGIAYDDPILGKDPQPKHMKDYLETLEDEGGVHINNGILNKAFYEAAIRIGTDRAGDIWVSALPKLSAVQTKDFSSLSKITYGLANANAGEQKAVREAWASVGLDPVLPLQTSQTYPSPKGSGANSEWSG